MLWWTLGYTYLFQFWFPRCVCRFLKHSLECFFKTPFRFLALPSPYEVKVNPLKAQPLNGTTTMFLSILKSFCTFNLYHVFYLKKVFLWYCPLFMLSSCLSICSFNMIWCIKKIFSALWRIPRGTFFKGICLFVEIKVTRYPVN